MGKTPVISIAYPLSIFLLAQFNLNFFSCTSRNIHFHCKLICMFIVREGGKKRGGEKRGGRTYSIGPGYELVVEFL